MKRTLAAALAGLLLWASAAPCLADVPHDVPLFPYEGQGPFVIIPARIPSSLVFQMGFMVGTFVCLPVSLAQDASGDNNLTRDQEASVICGRVVGVGLGWPVYAAVGLPFYLLKGLFWDGPRAIGRKFRKAPAADQSGGASGIRTRE